MIRIIILIIININIIFGLHGNLPPPMKHITELKLINDFNDKAVDVYWAKSRYIEIPQAHLYPNETATINTWEDHVFILRDMNTKLLLRTVVAERDNNTNIHYASGRNALIFNVNDNDDINLLNLTMSESPSVMGVEEINAKKNYLDNEKRPVIWYNDYQYTIKIFWIDHQGKEVFQHRLQHGWDTTLYTFVGHEFIMRNESNQIEISRKMIQPETRYIFVNSQRANTAFHREYEKRMGRPWLTVYPRRPLKHKMHPLLEVGESLIVETNAPQYKNGDDQNNLSKGSFKLTLTQASQEPRVYIIKNFLSNEEADHIVKIGKPRVKRSTVTDQAIVLKTRTSSNAWLGWSESPILRQIYRRGFATVNIPFDSKTADSMAESLQFLQYNKGQEYTRHQDWFPPFDPDYLHDPIIQRGYNRFATLFLYLNDVEEGGETVFPRFNGTSINDACREGFGVKPTKGDAVLFYSMLEDGNVDINSLHASCPVKKGTKFGANWWFWDHRRKL